MESAAHISGKLAFVGDRVRIVAADDFYAYCDGWTGTVGALNEGLIEVTCEREDGPKTLFVPGAQLALLPVEEAAAV